MFCSCSWMVCESSSLKNIATAFFIGSLYIDMSIAVRRTSCRVPNSRLGCRRASNSISDRGINMALRILEAWVVPWRTRNPSIPNLLVYTWAMLCFSLYFITLITMPSSFSCMPMSILPALGGNLIVISTCEDNLIPLKMNHK